VFIYIQINFFKLDRIEYAPTLSITCSSYFRQYQLQKVNELYNGQKTASHVDLLLNVSYIGYIVNSILCSSAVTMYVTPTMNSYLTEFCDDGTRGASAKERKLIEKIKLWQKKKKKYQHRSYPLNFVPWFRSQVFQILLIFFCTSLTLE
jgi:hypothetical protein